MKRLKCLFNKPKFPFGDHLLEETLSESGHIFTKSHCHLPFLLKAQNTQMVLGLTSKSEIAMGDKS